MVDALVDDLAEGGFCGSDASVDVLDLEARIPETAVDPVGEPRDVLDALLSLGVDLGEAMQKVTELYSPPRVVDTAQRRPSLNVEKGLRALYLSTPHPCGGYWDSIESPPSLPEVNCWTDCKSAF